MGCCGQKRAAIASRVAAKKPPSRGTAPSQPVDREQNGSSDTAPLSAGVYLRYRARSPIVVVGAHTAQRYEFSATVPVLRVDRRDADSLLHSGFFEKIV
jgi:hypothetical protein